MLCEQLTKGLCRGRTTSVKVGPTLRPPEKVKTLVFWEEQRRESVFSNRDDLELYAFCDQKRPEVFQNSMGIGRAKMVGSSTHSATRKVSIIRLPAGR